MDNKNKLGNTQQSTYVAMLIHDLKTPISAQITALNLLLNNTFGNLNGEQTEILSQILESCKYAQNLVHTILDTYLYELGHIKLEQNNFEWQNLIESAIKETKPLANEKKQKIVSVTNSLKNQITADKFQLKRVIVNLISNAIKYGFDKSTIELETEQNNDDLIFKVKSFSKYIKQKDALKLYDKFQTDGRGKSSLSCGLGLFLVKEIINAHNGQVFVENDSQGAYTFGFSIPVNK